MFKPRLFGRQYKRDTATPGTLNGEVNTRIPNLTLVSAGTNHVFSPLDLTGISAWYRADLGKTLSTSPVVATGTTPPTVTLSGTPVTSYSFDIQITGVGTLGVALFRWSSDGGSTWNGPTLTASSVVLGSTGVTANFGAGTYALNDEYTSFTTISAWADQSGTGDANKNAAQATSANQPKWLASSAGYNNQSVLNYVFALNQIMRTGTWTAALTQPFSMFTVCDTASTGQTGVVVEGDITASFTSGLFRDLNGGKFSAYAGTGLDSGSTGADGTKVILGGILNGASSKAYQSALTPVTGAAGAGGLTALSIGGRTAGLNNITGNIAEVIVCSAALNTTDISRLMTYFGNRYNISIGA